MIKAVLFDLDGTLLDTVGDIRAHLNAALRDFGYPEITLEETKRYVGDGAKKLVERAMPKDAKNVEECYQNFRMRYGNSDNSLTRPFEGAVSCLNKLAAAGVKLAIVTNKPQEATESCVRKFFAEIPFGFIGGDSGMFPCKPDPTLARFAALTLRVSPGECAFVGDGETDVKTAQNAEMFGIAALWGYRSQAQLKEAGATRFASDFSALEKILQIG